MEETLNKLISPRSRSLFGAFLAVVGLLGIGAFIAMGSNHSTLASILQWAMIVTLTLCSYYFGRVHPTIQELIDEARQRVESDRIAAMECAVTEIRQVGFRQMSPKEKALYFTFLTFFLFAIAAVCAGVADIFGLISPIRVKAADGSMKEVPHIISGLFFIMIGFVIYVATGLARTRTVDRIDEEIKRLFKASGKGLPSD